MEEEQLRELFESIGAALHRETTVVAIGGAPMVFRKQKPGTIDVDLIARGGEWKIIAKALEDIGFKVPEIGTHFEHPDGRSVDMGVDNFMGTPFTKRMLARVEKLTFNKLKLRMASNEDVILFKCMTERRKDIDDISKIIDTTHVKWDIILEESKKLTLEKKHLIYPTFVAVKLREIKNAGGPIDEKIIQKFENLGVEFYKNIGEKAPGFNRGDESPNTFGVLPKHYRLKRAKKRVKSPK